MMSSSIVGSLKAMLFLIEVENKNGLEGHNQIALLNDEYQNNLMDDDRI